MTLIVFPHAHHNFPAFGIIFEAGIVADPTATVKGVVVFHPPAKERNHDLTIIVRFLINLIKSDILTLISFVNDDVTVG